MLYLYFIGIVIVNSLITNYNYTNKAPLNAQGRFWSVIKLPLSNFRYK